MGDEGATVNPLIEVVEAPQIVSGTMAYYAYEYTSGNDVEGFGVGTSRPEAIKGALEELFEKYNAFGRGEVAAYVPPKGDQKDGKFISLRVDLDATGVTMEAIENVSTALSIAAMAAAPFTGGASLAIMAPIGLIGAIPAGYRLVDGAMAGTLRFDKLETWLDVIDIVGAGFGAAGDLASVGAKGTKVAAKGARTGLSKIPGPNGSMALIGAGIDNMGVILINVHTIDQINKINADPALSKGQKRAQIMMLLGGALQANGMAVGGKLMEMSGQGFDQDRIRPDGDDGFSSRMDEPTSPDVDELKMAPSAETVREGERKLEAPRRLVHDTDLSKALDKDLQLDFRVSRNVLDESNSIKVEFERDGWGLVTDIQIVAGKAAKPGDIKAHLATVKALQKYSGVSGMLRRVINKMMTYVGVHGDPPVGSFAFEAMLELRKLPEIIKLRQQELQRAIESGSERVPDIQKDIDHIREQMDFYQDAFTFDKDVEGRGYVALLGKDHFDKMKLDTPIGQQADLWRDTGEISTEVGKTLWSEKTSDDRLLSTKSDQQSALGKHYVQMLGLPVLNDHMFWFMTRKSGVYSLQVRTKGRPGRAHVTATAALKAGYPPPPAGHYYGFDPATKQLRLERFQDSSGVPSQKVIGAPPDVRFELSSELPIIPSVSFGTTDQRFLDQRAKLEQANDALNPQTNPDAAASPDASPDATPTRDQELADFVDQSDTFDDLIRRRAAASAEKAGLGKVKGDLNADEQKKWIAAHKEEINAGNLLGELSTEAYMRREFPNAERIYPYPVGDTPALTSKPLETDSLSGDFDQIWKIPGVGGKPDTYVLVESKGPKARLGRANPKGESGFKVEQGTQRDTQRVADQMATIELGNAPAPIDMATATEKQKAEYKKQMDAYERKVAAQDAGRLVDTALANDLDGRTDTTKPPAEPTVYYLHIKANLVDGPEGKKIGEPTVKMFDIWNKKITPTRTGQQQGDD